jgi:two-component system phosphate regulon sensor histidine kinase PhoR
LRTPLTVINGFLEIASAQPDLDAQTRVAHLAMMSEQGHRMQNLVEDMLSLTRLESMDYPVRQERVNIHNLLEQVLHEAQALSGGRHEISLTVNGPDIKGSIEELRSAFGNLASNAVRYTPQDGSITLAWQQSATGPQFSVRDTGIGIRPEHIPRLTERFYRVDKSRSRQTLGTGLGLAIVKHVLLRHKAVLTIESTPGQGSVFNATFPAAVIVEAAIG